MNDTHIKSLSLENPNPVICFAEDGRIVFNNSAVENLVHDMRLSSVEELLPSDHPDLLKKCVLNAQRLLIETIIGSRVFEWNYQIVPKGNKVNLYGYEVTERVIFESAYKSTLNDLQTGVIYVDSELHIYFINQSAHNILTSASELDIQQGRLSGETPLVINRLRQLASKVASQNSITNLVEVMSISRGASIVPLELLIAPIVSQDAIGTYQQPTVVLFLFDRAATTNAAEEVLARLYRLTPSEARLAKLIAQGISLKDAAITLGISTGTARTHLNHVFKKTGTHRQANLVQQINTGPALVQRKCTF